MANMENKLSTKVAIANPQVVFSRKSAVFRTPMIWLDDEKFEASPPPFEFCTKTIRINKMQVIIINTEKIGYNILY